MTVPSNVQSGDEATAAWANALLQAVRDEISDRTNGDAGLSSRVSTNADNIAELETEAAAASQSIAGNEGRITTLEGRDDELPDFPADERGELVLRARSDGMYFWDEDREVPSTPGTSTGVGHVLTVTGENDRDQHRWRCQE